jgi:serine/threonine protein kinase
MQSQTVYRNALPLGTALLEYRLERVLGAGAFGITYLARDVHLDKDVALKEYLPSELALRAPEGTVQPLTTEREPDYRWGLDRFLQEARTLGKFSHRNIVRVLRYFEANATAYMVMEYERGDSLKSVLTQNPQISEAQLRRMLDPLLDGLAAVHAAGFLHRDIKPDNLFIRAGGEPVLIDFGSARHALGAETRGLTAILTPGFAPLEQYSGDGRQGPWTDLYALGGVLYRAITGEKPPDAVARMRADGVSEKLQAASSRFSAQFLRAVSWALMLDEKKRPQSVDQWRAALRGEASAAPKPAEIEKTVVLKPPPKRRRWPYVVAALLLVFAVAAVLTNRRRSLPPDTAVAAVPASVEAEFRAADGNGDGVLSRDEVRGRFPMIARNFERVDADGNGFISLREFANLRRMQFERRLDKGWK